MKRIVLLGLFQKQEDPWVSLTFGDVLGCPKAQAVEMTKCHVKRDSSVCPSEHWHTQDKAVTFLLASPPPLLWEQLLEHIHGVFLGKPPQSVLMWFFSGKSSKMSSGNKNS